MRTIDADLVVYVAKRIFGDGLTLREVSAEAGIPLAVLAERLGLCG